MAIGDGTAVDPSLTLAATPNFINPAYATPEQRKQLYEYANELMKPQDVKSGWQGLANIARALVGGYESHQGDIAEQASRANDAAQAAAVAGQAYSPPNGAAPAPDSGAAPPPASPPISVPGATPATGAGPVAPAVDPSAVAGKQYPNTPAGHAAFNHDYALARAATAKNPNYDPTLTQNIAGTEGNNATGWKSPNLASTSDVDANGKPFSFADYQLNVRNGLGVDARKAGIDPADPNQWQQANKFAIDYQADHGYAPWKGDQAMQAYQAAKSAPSSPAMAMGKMLVAGPGAPSPAPSNGLPVSPGAIGQFLANPNLDPSVKAASMAILAPKMYQSATGQVLPSYQNQPVGAPVAKLGVPGPVIAGAVPSFVGGTPDAPTSTIAPPGLAGAPPAGGAPPAPGATPAVPPSVPPNLGASVLGPGSPAGSIIAQQQLNEAQGGAITAMQKANQERYQATIGRTGELQNAQYPLRQLQAVLDKNGGTLPTGQGSEDVMSAASVGNMISTLLGHPLAQEDSKLTQMELLRKYGTQVAMSLTGRPTDLGYESAATVSPSTHIAGPTNSHLVDNYIRLNELAQKKNQFEHEYYLSHGQGPHAYDNFAQDWTNEISGAKAIPLSKYGREVTLKDGSKGVYVPSTDPSGFSLFPVNDPAFQGSVMTPEAK